MKDRYRILHRNGEYKIEKRLIIFNFSFGWVDYCDGSQNRFPEYQIAKTEIDNCVASHNLWEVCEI